MPSEADYKTQLARVQREDRDNYAARIKAHEMHGGSDPSPMEPAPPRIITQFGAWAVTPFGVECLTYPYQIQWDSLLDDKTDDEYWLRYLAKKPWLDNLGDFIDAVRHGRRIHRYLQGESLDGDSSV